MAIVRNVMIFIFSLLFISGCATKRPELTRQQWLEITTRTYHDITKDEALSAAQKIFKLADGDDFIIVHTKNGLKATRNWIIYLILTAENGTDYWLVEAEDIQGGVKVSVQVNTQRQSITPITTTSGSWTATTLPMAGTPVTGTAIYDVFWARMDYLLGKRNDWMDCKKADERVKKGITWGSNEALCNSFNIKDETPK